VKICARQPGLVEDNGIARMLDDFARLRMHVELHQAERETMGVGLSLLFSEARCFRIAAPAGRSGRPSLSQRRHRRTLRAVVDARGAARRLHRARLVADRQPAEDRRPRLLLLLRQLRLDHTPARTAREFPDTREIGVSVSGFGSGAVSSGCPLASRGHWWSGSSAIGPAWVMR